VELLTITNSDGQQFHQYQQNKENLNSDGQQFHKYQQNKESLNSDGQQFFVVLILVELLTITV
jgi:hypothetical protein